MRTDLKNTIFISYRRKDTASAAGRLHDYLEKEFGADMVFKDIHDIGLGTDFRKAIGSTLMKCKVVLVLIGDRYVTLTDAEGNIRLMNPADYVNIEVSTALTFKNEKLVIPILVNGARMPKRDQLPASMESLTWQNSKKLSSEYWQTDIERLNKAISQYLRISPRKPTPPVRQNIPQQVVSRPPVKQKSSGTGLLKGILIGAVALFILLIGIGIAYAPEEDAYNPASSNFDSFTAFVNAEKLNVRSAPGTNGTSIIFQLNKGDAVKVNNARNFDGKEWYRVTINGEAGWISSDYVSNSTEEITMNPVIAPDPAIVDIRQQPVTTYTYQQLVVGHWVLNRLSYNGESLSLPEFMQAMAGDQMVVHTANLSYTINNATNTISSSINGMMLDTEYHNYQINGNIFTMSNGTVANIDLLNQNKMQLSINSFDGFENGRLTFYFSRN